MASDKIERLQLLQQNMQHLLQQKQHFESQETEFESAITELKTTTNAYKIVGKIMISTDKETLLKELEEKKETNHARLSNILKQEEALKVNLEQVQKEAMSEMKNDQ